jgi:hypothetical protein
MFTLCSLLGEEPTFHISAGSLPLSNLPANAAIFFNLKAPSFLIALSFVVDLNLRFSIYVEVRRDDVSRTPALTNMIVYINVARKDTCLYVQMWYYVFLSNVIWSNIIWSKINLV